MPNGVIMGINLRQEMICSTYHDIFIRYHHSVMNLLITSDKYCDMGMRQKLSVTKHYMETSYYHTNVSLKQQFMS